jgi:hypothetical protein
MNQRIKKLAKKSGATLNEGFDGNKAFVYGITMSPEELEKFAELIVNQCADIAQQHNKSPVAAPLAIGYVIREHFGVEE